MKFAVFDLVAFLIVVVIAFVIAFAIACAISFSDWNFGLKWLYYIIYFNIKKKFWLVYVYAQEYTSMHIRTTYIYIIEICMHWQIHVPVCVFIMYSVCFSTCYKVILRLFCKVKPVWFNCSSCTCVAADSQQFDLIFFFDGLLEYPALHGIPCTTK